MLGAACRLAIAPVALLTALGCSDISRFDTAADFGTSPSSPANTGATLDSNDTAPAVLPATYYSVTATLVVTKQAIDTKASTLRFDYWDDDLLCSVSPTLSAASNELPPKDQPIAVWWQLTLDKGADEDCTYDYPETLFLGLGAMDPALLPNLNTLPLDPAYLYGAYVQDREDDVWVFGYAGTAEHLKKLTRADRATVIDGTYQVEPLLLLPLD